MLRDSGLSSGVKPSLSRAEKVMEEIMSPKDKVRSGDMEKGTWQGLQSMEGRSHCQNYDTSAGQVRNTLTPWSDPFGSQRTKALR